MPSPTIATVLPDRCSSATFAAFSSGSTSATTSGAPAVASPDLYPAPEPSGSVSIELHCSGATNDVRTVAFGLPFPRGFVADTERIRLEDSGEEIASDVLELAGAAIQIEDHYGRPMDIEWAIDKDLPAGGNIFILQARPETIWSSKPKPAVSTGASSAMDFIVSSLIAASAFAQTAPASTATPPSTRVRAASGR